MTRAFGNARPSSSAVRLAPTVTARSFVPSQTGHRQAPALVPHSTQRGSPPLRGTARAPPHATQRAGSRQRSHASAGALPGLATCTSTGPSRTASWACRHAAEGMRADPGSGAACCSVGMILRLRVARRPRRRAPSRSRRGARPRRSGCAPARSSAAPLCSWRTSAASRGCTPGASGSLSSASPSSQIAMRPEARRGRVDRGAIAHDDARVVAGRVEEGAVPVAARLPRVGAQHPTRVDGCRERRLELLLVAVVGHDERAPSGRRRGCARRPARASRPTRRPTPPTAGAADADRRPAAIRSPCDRCRPRSDRPGSRGSGAPRRAAGPDRPARRATTARPARSGSGSRGAGRRSRCPPRDRRPRGRAPTPRA